MLKPHFMHETWDRVVAVNNQIVVCPCLSSLVRTTNDVVCHPVGAAGARNSLLLYPVEAFATLPMPT